MPPEADILGSGRPGDDGECSIGPSSVAVDVRVRFPGGLAYRPCSLMRSWSASRHSEFSPGVKSCM